MNLNEIHSKQIQNNLKIKYENASDIEDSDEPVNNDDDDSNGNINSGGSDNAIGALNEIEIGKWAMVFYDDEPYIGIVCDKGIDPDTNVELALVQCLEHPGMTGFTAQCLEKARQSVWFSTKEISVHRRNCFIKL